MLVAKAGRDEWTSTEPVVQARGCIGPWTDAKMKTRRFWLCGFSCSGRRKTDSYNNI